jgi:nucleotide-binding universal stress UspA family protein
MPALRNILIAVKPASAEAHPLGSAITLAASARARLTVLTVAASPESRPGVETGLEERFTVRHVVGIPAIEIAREAESRGVDLIVLGRDLPIPLDPRRNGNTAEGTVRRARVPCLLVPGGQEGFQRVLAAVDGGPDSGDVVAAARLVGRAFDAAVRVVRVEEPVLAGVGAPAWSHEPSPSVSPAVGGECETIVRHGDPVSEVLRVVREQDIDLLVFGHHRGGPVSAHATSGIAARLLQRAPCAVLTVPI